MNTVCHIEFQTTDLDRAEAFYKGVFGWEFKSFMPSMRVFGTGETHVGGIILMENVEPGNSPSVWLQVASLDETLARVTASGGKSANERMEVPGTGWSDAFRDPDGNYVGVVQFG